jgi:hypothetical protein
MILCCVYFQETAEDLRTSGEAPTFIGFEEYDTVKQ